MSPESPLPPYYTYILATLRVAPDLPSGTEPGNPLRLRFSLTPSLRRVRNPGRRIVGRARAPQEEAHTGTEVADLLRGVEKEHDRRRGLPALGNPTPPVARDQRAGQGRRLRRVQEGSGATQARSRHGGARAGVVARQQGIPRARHREHLLRGKTDGV